MAERKVPRRWRDHQSATGNRPVKKFLKGLTKLDQASIAAAMAEVRKDGLSVAKHVQDDIYEVKADGEDQTFRVLFAAEGDHSQVLLALEALSKKTQKLPPKTIALAKKRLTDWRKRSREQTGSEEQSDRGRRPQRENRRRG